MKLSEGVVGWGWRDQGCGVDISTEIHKRLFLSLQEALIVISSIEKVPEAKRLAEVTREIKDRRKPVLGPQASGEEGRIL